MTVKPARYRCIGAIHGPVGDCLTPAAGALVCYGYLDRDEGVPLRESLDGPVPMVFPVCTVHRAPLVQWAEHLWGRIANGMWVSADGIAWVIRELEAERVELYPDPTQAVGVYDAVG